MEKRQIANRKKITNRKSKKITNRRLGVYALSDLLSVQMKNKAKFPIPTLIPALTMDRKLAHPWRPPASVVEGDDALLKSLKIFLTFSGLNSRTKVLGIIPRIRNITKITDYKDKRFTFHL